MAWKHLRFSITLSGIFKLHIADLQLYLWLELRQRARRFMSVTGKICYNLQAIKGFVNIIVSAPLPLAAKFHKCFHFRNCWFGSIHKLARLFSRRLKVNQCFFSYFIYTRINWGWMRHKWNFHPDDYNANSPCNVEFINYWKRCFNEDLKTALKYKDDQLMKFTVKWFF